MKSIQSTEQQLQSTAAESTNNKMTWEKPAIQETECGMEINMYSPIDGDEPLF